jgi:hypothetical protein
MKTQHLTTVLDVHGFSRDEELAMECHFHSCVTHRKLIQDALQRNQVIFAHFALHRLGEHPLQLRVVSYGAQRSLASLPSLLWALVLEALVRPSIVLQQIKAQSKLEGDCGGIDAGFS